MRKGKQMGGNGPSLSHFVVVSLAFWDLGFSSPCFCLLTIFSFKFCLDYDDNGSQVHLFTTVGPYWSTLAWFFWSVLNCLFICVKLCIFEVSC